MHSLKQGISLALVAAGLAIAPTTVASSASPVAADREGRLTEKPAQVQQRPDGDRPAGLGRPAGLTKETGRQTFLVVLKGKPTGQVYDATLAQGNKTEARQAAKTRLDAIRRAQNTAIAALPAKSRVALPHPRRASCRRGHAPMRRNIEPAAGAARRHHGLPDRHRRARATPTPSRSRARPQVWTALAGPRSGHERRDHRHRHRLHPRQLRRARARSRRTTTAQAGDGNAPGLFPGDQGHRRLRPRRRQLRRRPATPTYDPVPPRRLPARLQRSRLPRRRHRCRARREHRRHAPTPAPTTPARRSTR